MSLEIGQTEYIHDWVYSSRHSIEKHSSSQYDIAT